MWTNHGRDLARRRIFRRRFPRQFLLLATTHCLVLAAGVDIKDPKDGLRAPSDAASVIAYE